MQALVRISDFLDRWIVRIGRVAAWAAIPLMAVIIFDVITRRFLVLGSTKLQELEWHIHTALFALCLGYAYLKDAHVRIDIVRERLPARVQWWIELIGCLLFLIPYCAIILYYGVDWWYRSFALDEASGSATGLANRWIIKAALPAGFVLLLGSALVVLLRRIVLIFGPEQVRQVVEEEEAAEVEHLDEVVLPDGQSEPR